MEPKNQPSGRSGREEAKKLLVLYADAERAAGLTQSLSAAGFDVVASPLSISREGWVDQLRPHLILLLPPPEPDSLLEACETLRKDSDLPVVLLSECADELSITRALELGIDEYLVEPIGERELLARIEAILRRILRYRDAEEAYQLGELSLSPIDQSVELRGNKIALSPIEFRLLSCLVSAPGKVLTHQTLMARVWGAEYVDSRHYLRLYVRYLREKLEEDPTKPQMIISEWGVGYRFEAPASIAVA